MTAWKERQSFLAVVAPGWLVLLLLTGIAYSGLNIHYLAFVPFLLLWCACVLTPVFLLVSRMLAAQHCRTRTMAAILGIALFGAVMPLLGQRVTVLRVQATMERAEPMLEAIARYTREREHPPDNLAELVPGFLPSVPDAWFLCSLRYVRLGEYWQVWLEQPNPGLEEYIAWVYSTDPLDALDEPACRIGRYTWTRYVYD